MILISTEEEAVTKAEFKVKGEALTFTLALAVSVTKPLAKVNGSEPIITLAAWPVAVEAPTEPPVDFADSES